MNVFNFIEIKFRAGWVILPLKLMVADEPLFGFDTVPVDWQFFDRISKSTLGSVSRTFCFWVFPLLIVRNFTLSVTELEVSLMYIIVQSWHERL